MKNFGIWVLMALFAVQNALVGQKMTVEQILTNHLESIGTNQKRGDMKNSVAAANVGFNLKGSAVKVNGKAVLVSVGDKNLWGMLFNSNDYPQDKFGFNGNEVRAGFIRPGVYSTLGGFLLSYKEILREGLLGGTLLSSWALMHTDVNKPKLTFDGTKKIDGNDTYIVGYGVKGGSDLSIKIYFDMKTYRHVRTEYSHVVAARQGTTIDNSAGQSADRYVVTEDFSDFQKVGGLTVPKKYKLSYSYSGSSSIRTVQSAYKELEWDFDLTNFVINQDIDPGTFEIGTE